MSTQKVTMKDLMAMRKQFETGDSGVRYSEEFKKKVIQFHYDNGVSINVMSQALKIGNDVLSKWKRRLGTEQTAFVHGKTMRHDVRTKALAVRELLEDNVHIKDLAAKYACSKSAIYLWSEKYQHNYKQLIDAPDGIPYLVAEKKMVYGNDNIAKIRQVLREQYQTLMCMIDTMHMTGDQADLMKKCAEESLKKEEALVKAVSVLEENGIDITLK